MKNKFISTQELGSLLGVTRQTIRNWIKKGDIQAFHIGQNLKIPIQEVFRILTYYGLPFPDWLKQKADAPTLKAAKNAQQPWAGPSDIGGSSFPNHISAPTTGRSLSNWTQETGDGR